QRGGVMDRFAIDGRDTTVVGPETGPTATSETCLSGTGPCFGPDDHDDTLERIEGWIRTELPTWNTAVESGTAEVESLMVIIMPMITTIRAIFGPLKDRLPRRTARRLIGLLGFLIGSLERHFRARGDEAGTTWKFLPELEVLMTDLG